MATKEQIYQALQNAHKAGDVESAKKLALMYKQADVQPQGDPVSTGEKIATGMDDPISGLAQLVSHASPALADLDQKASNWMYDKSGGKKLLGMQLGYPEKTFDEAIKKREQDYQGRRTESGDGGFDGYRLIGNVLSPANLAISSKVPAAAGIGKKVLTGIAAGSVFGAENPVYGDDFNKEKAIQTAVGGITGGLFPVATSAASRAVKPLASSNEKLATLIKEGINPTIGQALGGSWNKTEEKLQSLPLMGDMISHARRSANSELQAAAFNRALNPIKDSLPKGLDGRDAVVYTENALKDKYNTVLNKIGAIKLDDQFHKSNDELMKMVGSLKMPEAEKQKFSLAFDDITSSLDKGVLTSDAYKSLESSLGSDASKLYGSQNIYDGKLAPAVKQLQQNLRDLLKRQAGEHADELSSVNAGWANFKRVQNASTKLGAENGNFTPAQLANAVRALDKSKDKASYARGNALMQDLSDAGKSILADKVPDSGTATRAILGAGAVGSGAISPAIPLALAGGGAAYTSPIQKLLVSILTKRPEAANDLANLIQRPEAQALIPALIPQRQQN